MNEASEVHTTNHAKHRFVALGLAAFLVGIATPAGLLIWQATSPTVVMREGPAGKLIATRVDRSIFPTETLTRIDTSIGNVVVQGPFSGTRGSSLAVVQLNKLRSLRLCVAGASTRCAPLAGVWAGRLTPTAAARHAVDFQRYGMTTSDLAGCIGLGVLALGVVVLVGVIQRSDCDEDECTDTVRSS